MPTPPPRPLIAATVALMLLLAFNAVLFLTRRTLGGWMTPLGLVAPLDLAGIAVSMLVGGVIARRGFAPTAVALVFVVAAASALSAYAVAPRDGHLVASRWLLRHAGLQTVVSMGVAWGAAWLGERVAARRQPS